MTPGRAVLQAAGTSWVQTEPGASLNLSGADSRGRWAVVQWDERAQERTLAAGRWLHGLTAAEATGDPLVLVTFWKVWLDDTEDQLREAVTAARAAGRTWEQIGQALGVTKQSAWVMFRPHERDPGPGQGPATAG